MASSVPHIRFSDDVGGDGLGSDAPHPRPTLTDVVARLAENGFEREVARCVCICKDARSNAQLWERVVNLLHADAGMGMGGYNFYRTTALIHWAAAGDLVRVREALVRGANVNASDSRGWTALYSATRGGHAAVVRELLDRGAAVDARTHGGWTPMMGAAFDGNPALIFELAARGADVNMRDGAGVSPLMRACWCGHAATAAELLRFGANVNAQKNGGGRSPLMHAACNGHIDAVRVLLAVPGVDVNLVTARGVTALSWARVYRRDAIVALLEAAGAR